MKESILKPQELKKREDIVKGMKDNASKFVKSYGKDAEQVMYASATKKAKNLKETELFKISPELAFKIYNILSKQYPDIYKDHTKSSFFNYLNSNLNESKQSTLGLKTFIKEFFKK
jgi:hypothetical protein